MCRRVATARSSPGSATLVRPAPRGTEPERRASAASSSPLCHSDGAPPFDGVAGHSATGFRLLASTPNRGSAKTAAITKRIAAKLPGPENGPEHFPQTTPSAAAYREAATDLARSAGQVLQTICHQPNRPRGRLVTPDEASWERRSRRGADCLTSDPAASQGPPADAALGAYYRWC